MSDLKGLGRLADYDECHAAELMERWMFLQYAYTYLAEAQQEPFADRVETIVQSIRACPALQKLTVSALHEFADAFFRGMKNVNWARVQLIKILLQGSEQLSSSSLN